MEIKPIGGAIWRTGAGRDDVREMEGVKGALEAMLFVADEPLTPRRLAEALECDEGTVLSALQELRDEYVRYNRGMQLRELGGGWRMHTHPAYAAQIERLLLASRRTRLTRAAVETLAIIAYMQPITRTQVANIRGVQSENMVKALEEMGLVAEAGKEKAPGGPALYVTTEKFLERFGLNSLEELPPLEDFQPDAETVDRIARSLSGQEVRPHGENVSGGEELAGVQDELAGEEEPGFSAPEALPGEILSADDGGSSLAMPPAYGPGSESGGVGGGP